jgi:hypothetical protein
MDFLQNPVPSQLWWLLSTHAPAGKGSSLPAGSGEQIPSRAETEQP